MFSVSGRMSTKTGVAPRSTNALAVETKVNDGMITSSPGPTPLRMAAISSAAVQEWVRSAFWLPIRASSQAQQRFENSPFPARWPFAWAWAMYDSSRPVMNGLLKGIMRRAPRRRRLRATSSSDPPAGKDTPRRIEGALQRS